MKTVLEAYQLDPQQFNTRPFGTGLINHTWLLEGEDQSFILQKINEAVFKDPKKIDNNIRTIATAFKANYPDYLFVSPLANRNGETLTYIADEGYYRLFHFIPGSHAVDAVENAAQAYEAAAQFGKFTALLNTISANQLKETIPGFHDLSLRYREFCDAIVNGNKKRIDENQLVLDTLLSFKPLVYDFIDISQSHFFKKRVTHHDTKISNVLFDSDNKGLCVIDLDTVMPGLFISDVGDMMRTYLSAVTEEEADLSKVKVREDIYKAIVDGYISAMHNELTGPEKRSFFFAAKFMIYMQALRFATDYLNDDKYYGARYPEHNMVRAKNQLALLEDLLAKEPVLGSYPF